MNRTEFRQALLERLQQMSPEDRQLALDFFDEMIDERMDEGMTEAQAVADLGDVDTLAQRLLPDTPAQVPLITQFFNRLPKKTAFSPWQIVIGLPTLPIWLPLLILIPILGISLLIALFGLLLGLAVAGGGLVIAGIMTLVSGPFVAPLTLMNQLFHLGLGLTLIGIGLLLLPLLSQFSRWIQRLYRRRPHA